VRATEEAFQLPDELRDGDGGLIYLSLGSLGSADVDLMKHLIEILADTPHRYIVSKGPRADEFDLADNMWGEARLPQTSIIPIADLVITHGGNNTTTESFHFGKPMIVLPLFWDQYDNAQRVQEIGCGVRLDTYRFEDRQLTQSIDDLLANIDLRRRMERDAEAIRKADGKTTAADLIEGVARIRPSK
jgi:UDP:flavonoid glycosyltransferase YjiC (YdhE family)